MQVQLQYGHNGLCVDLPSGSVRVIELRFLPGLPDELRHSKRLFAARSLPRRSKT